MSGLISFLKAADPRNWKKVENQERYHVAALDMAHCVAKFDASISSGFTNIYQLPESAFTGKSFIGSIHGIADRGRRISPMQLNLIGYNKIMVTTHKPIVHDLELLCMLVVPKLVVEPPPKPVTLVPTPKDVAALISDLPLPVVRTLDAFRMKLSSDEFVRTSLMHGNELILSTRENLSNTYIKVVVAELEKCGWLVKETDYNPSSLSYVFVLTMPSVD